MSNKVTYGMKQAYYALWDDTLQAFNTPIPIPGARAFSCETSIEDSITYADDSAYITIPGTPEESGSHTFLDFPESYLTDCLGKFKNANGILSDDSDARKNHAIMFKETIRDSLGVSKEVIIVYYNILAGVPTINSATKEASAEAKEFETAFTSSPHPVIKDDRVSGAKNISNAIIFQDTTTEHFFINYGTEIPLPTTVATP